MAKQLTPEEKLEALKQAIAEQQAIYNKFVTEIEEIALKHKAAKDEYITLEAQKEKLLGEITGVKSTLSDLHSQVEDQTFKKEALEVQLEEMQELVEGLAIGKKESGPKPGMYLKDNRVHIPGFGLREKDKGPLSEAELKAFYGAFDGWTKKEVIKKFLIEVKEEE